jgi:hypothetical protein
MPEQLGLRRSATSNRADVAQSWSRPSCEYSILMNGHQLPADVASGDGELVVISPFITTIK